MEIFNSFLRIHKLFIYLLINTNAVSTMNTIIQKDKDTYKYDYSFIWWSLLVKRYWIKKTTIIDTSTTNI